MWALLGARMNRDPLCVDAIQDIYQTPMLATYQIQSPQIPPNKLILTQKPYTQYLIIRNDL